LLVVQIDTHAMRTMTSMKNVSEILISKARLKNRFMELAGQ
jgi:hypothetical protein